MTTDCFSIHMDVRLADLGLKPQRNVFHDLNHVADLPLNTLTPVPEVSTRKLIKIFCYLLKFSSMLIDICKDLESNAKCSRFGGGYFINVIIAHVCT